MKLKFAEENQGSNNITGSFMRRFRPLNRGLLLIYGVADAKNNSEYPFGDINGQPYYGFAASFPTNKPGQRLETIASNAVWLQTELSDFGRRNHDTKELNEIWREFKYQSKSMHLLL